MYRHYYQGPYEYEREDNKVQLSDVVVPQTVYEKQSNIISGNPQPDELDERDFAPPHSKTPFNIGTNIYNPQTKRFLEKFALDDIILLALVVLFLTDTECDNTLLIILAFLFLSGISGENGLF